jgi:small subunit ribosomal protein S26e
MPSKRRNNGRGKKNKGHADNVVCCQSGRLVPKDKAIKRFQIKKIVDESSRKDIQDNSAYPDGEFHLPKMYMKMYYSVSCAIHSRVVRVRSQTRGDRNVRYTTKVRRTRVEDARTGGFAKVAPNLAKTLNRTGGFNGPRKPMDAKPAAPKDAPAAATATAAPTEGA